jgi:hypothetical protein
MKHPTEGREAPIEQLLAELDYCLTDVSDKLPELETQFHDLKITCGAACGILSEIEDRLIPRK